MKPQLKLRKALLEDSESIALLLLLAMEDIVFKFIGEEDSIKARDFLLHFVKLERNQYSYQNCYVAEMDGTVLAAANVYNGTALKTLREPVKIYVENNFRKDFAPEDETGPGEFYIDSLGVSAQYRGAGIGSQLLLFLIDHYVTKKNHTLGLLVTEENVNAKKLYLKLGFTVEGSKILLGEKLLHMQVKKRS